MYGVYLDSHTILANKSIEFRLVLHNGEYMRELVTRAVMIVDLLRYDNFVVCYTESYPQRIT